MIPGGLEEGLIVRSRRAARPGLKNSPGGAGWAGQSSASLYRVDFDYFAASPRPQLDNTRRLCLM